MTNLKDILKVSALGLTIGVGAVAALAPNTAHATVEGGGRGGSAGEGGSCDGCGGDKPDSDKTTGPSEYQCVLSMTVPNETTGHIGSHGTYTNNVTYSGVSGQLEYSIYAGPVTLLNANLNDCGVALVDDIAKQAAEQCVKFTGFTISGNNGYVAAPSPFHVLKNCPSTNTGGGSSTSTQEEVKPEPKPVIDATLVMPSSCGANIDLREALKKGTNTDTYVRRELQTLQDREDVITNDLTTSQIGDIALCDAYAVISEESVSGRVDACFFNTMNQDGELVIGDDAKRFAETGDTSFCPTDIQEVIVPQTCDAEKAEIERLKALIAIEANGNFSETITDTRSTALIAEEQSCDINDFSQSELIEAYIDRHVAEQNANNVCRVGDTGTMPPDELKAMFNNEASTIVVTDNVVMIELDGTVASLPRIDIPVDPSFNMELPQGGALMAPRP